ncbi:Thioredoxin-like fold [Pseudocohnilembus persalinus]|uniref:Thioredoxin-like fold n=1 Tax=Pseudocohnilembus persalinus TaxID=266149 RepID=A0A0V0QK56_PSEPJ|nr:Thioredoxin-like fold [Pseudocohnilembus persalinus]|eukprot:KRX02546.1 Thioredoxin-like fold [Pseudocohnilembus persalinus]
MAHQPNRNSRNRRNNNINNQQQQQQFRNNIPNRQQQQQLSNIPIDLNVQTDSNNNMIIQQMDQIIQMNQDGMDIQCGNNLLVKMGQNGITIQTNGNQINLGGLNCFQLQQNNQNFNINIEYNNVEGGDRHSNNYQLNVSRNQNNQRRINEFIQNLQNQQCQQNQIGNNAQDDEDEYENEEDYEENSDDYEEFEQQRYDNINQNIIMQPTNCNENLDNSDLNSQYGRQKQQIILNNCNKNEQEKENENEDDEYAECDDDNNDNVVINYFPEEQKQNSHEQQNRHIFTNEYHDFQNFPFFQNQVQNNINNNMQPNNQIIQHIQNNSFDSRQELNEEENLQQQQYIRDYNDNDDNNDEDEEFQDEGEEHFFQQDDDESESESEDESEDEYDDSDEDDDDNEYEEQIETDDDNQKMPGLSHSQIERFPIRIYKLDEELTSKNSSQRKIQSTNLTNSKDQNSQERHQATQKEKNSSYKQCVICINEYISNDVIMSLPCFHNFHQHCIKEWLQNTGTCPICKFEIFKHLQDEQKDGQNFMQSNSNNLSSGGQILSNQISSQDNESQQIRYNLFDQQSINDSEFNMNQNPGNLEDQSLYQSQQQFNSFLDYQQQQNQSQNNQIEIQQDQNMHPQQLYQEKNNKSPQYLEDAQNNQKQNQFYKNIQDQVYNQSISGNEEDDYDSNSQNLAKQQNGENIYEEQQINQMIPFFFSEIKNCSNNDIPSLLFKQYQTQNIKYNNKQMKADTIQDQNLQQQLKQNQIRQQNIDSHFKQVQNLKNNQFIPSNQQPQINQIYKDIQNYQESKNQFQNQEICINKQKYNLDNIRQQNLLQQHKKNKKQFNEDIQYQQQEEEESKNNNKKCQLEQNNKFEYHKTGSLQKNQINSEKIQDIQQVKIITNKGSINQLNQGNIIKKIFITHYDQFFYFCEFYIEQYLEKQNQRQNFQAPIQNNQLIQQSDQQFFLSKNYQKHQEQIRQFYTPNKKNMMEQNYKDNLHENLQKCPQTERDINNSKINQALQQFRRQQILEQQQNQNKRDYNIMVSQQKEINFKDFESQFDNEIKGLKNAFVVFMASNGEDNKPWCPCCTEALSFIEKLQSAASEAMVRLYIVRAGSKSEWEDENNPLKTLTQTKIDKIPTIILYQEGKIARRVEYDDLRAMPNPSELITNLL